MAALTASTAALRPLKAALPQSRTTSSTRARAIVCSQTASAKEELPLAKRLAKGIITLGAAAIVLPCCRAGGAVAADFPEALLNQGAGVFSNTCATCHTGGQNIIEADKTLAKDALTEYLDGGFNVDAIERQVTNGKNAMPAKGGADLSPDQIKAVAAYVYNQAANDLW